MSAPSPPYTGRRRERGISVLGVAVVVVVLGVGGFVGYRFYAAGAMKMEIEREATEVLDRAFRGQSVAKIADGLRTFASERGCEATSGAPRIVLEPSENPDKVSVSFECSLPVNLVIVKVAKHVKIEKSRQRSAAFRTIQSVKDKLQRAQERHDQRLEQRFRGAE